MLPDRPRVGSKTETIMISSGMTRSYLYHLKLWLSRSPAQARSDSSCLACIVATTTSILIKIIHYSLSLFHRGTIHQESIQAGSILPTKSVKLTSPLCLVARWSLSLSSTMVLNLQVRTGQLMALTPCFFVRW